MKNFNHERWLIAVQAARGSHATCTPVLLVGARNCYEESIKYAMKRQTFGKPLISHQIIRFKLAEMARMVFNLYLATLSNLFLAD